MDIDQIIDELQPLIYQHVCMLTAAGSTLERALKMASLTVVQIYSGDHLREALEAAEHASNVAPVDRSMT